MNDTIQTNQAAQPTEVPQATPDNAESKLPTLQDVEKKFFPAEQLEASTAYINEVIAIAARENVEPLFNFDTEAEFPKSYGIAVIPMQKRVAERGNQTFGIVIAAIPSVDALQADDSGENWVIKIITDALIRQVTTASKPKEDGMLVSIPFKIADFTTTSRSSGLAAFNAVASDYVKALKQKGLKFMSKVLLRQVLSSAAFAEQQFPRLSQDNWNLVLDSMVSHVKSKGIDSGILTHWKATRDEIEIDDTEIDLSDLDAML